MRDIPLITSFGNIYSNSGGDHKPSRFNPLKLNPFLYFDAAQGSMLKAGGTAAGYLDSVPTLKNLATGSNKGSDATQSTGTYQGRALPLINGMGYLHCPGVGGNYASIPYEPSLNVSSNFTIEVTGNFSNMLVGGWYALLSKSNSSTNDFSFYIANGGLGFYANAIEVYQPSLLSSNCDGVRVVVGSDIRFYQKINGVWSQLGSSMGNMGITANQVPIILGARAGGGVDFVKGALQTAKLFNTTTPDSSSPILNIDFTDPNVAHNAASFVCSTGQTVTINKSGNDDAVLVRKPCVRFDGVDDWVNGTFTSTLTNGRMFCIYRARSLTSSTFDRIFCVAANGLKDYNNIYGYNFGHRVAGTNDLITWYNGNGLITITNQFISRKILESTTNGTSKLSINGGSYYLNSTNTSSLSSNRFAIGNSFDGTGLDRCAMDLEHLSLFPASMTDTQASQMVKMLNNKYRVF